MAALAASVVWVCLAGNAGAQQPGTRMQAPMAAPPIVALVDVNYIFKKHARFKDQMQILRGEIDAAQNGFKQRNDELVKEVQRFESLGIRPGTPDFKQKDEEITALKMKLQLDAKNAQKEFALRESKIYYNTYLEIQQEVKYFCEQNNVSLVLSFSREKGNPDVPDEVIRQINSKVVFSRDELDISQFILNRLSPENRQPAGPSANTNNGPTGFTPGAGFQR